MILTGASKGIGKSMAIQLAQLGAKYADELGSRGYQAGLEYCYPPL